MFRNSCLDFCENLNLKTVTQNWTEVSPPPQKKEKEQTKQKENVN